MGRTITIEDDDSGITSRVFISSNASGAVVHRIEITGDVTVGLPDEVLASVIPHIGLPPSRAQQSHSRPAPPTRQPDPEPPAAVNRAVDRAALSFQSADPAKASATPRRRTVPTPDTARAVQASAPMTGTRRPYRRAPSDADLIAACRELDTASPSRLADHFKVPAHTVSNWLNRMRQRQRNQESR